MPYTLLGLLTLIFLVAGTYTWEYTNSPAFCGESCHTMPPEYAAYQISPHARVACVECHIGGDFISQRITRKAGDIRHVTATLFSTYEFPIYADNLAPGAGDLRALPLSVQVLPMTHSPAEHQL